MVPYIHFKTSDWEDWYERMEARGASKEALRKARAKPEKRAHRTREPISPRRAYARALRDE
jgi:hypothetical protein